MKIAITAGPEFPVPPHLYGGIERIIDMLVHGLVSSGHDVTLFTHSESDVPCRVISFTGNIRLTHTDTLRNICLYRQL